MRTTGLRHEAAGWVCCSAFRPTGLLLLTIGQRSKHCGRRIGCRWCGAKASRGALHNACLHASIRCSRVLYTILHDRFLPCAPNSHTLPRMRIGSVSSELLHNAPSGRTPPRIGDSTDKALRWRRKSPCRFMAADIICVDCIDLDAWPKITPWLPHLNCAPAVLSTATTRENRTGLD